MLMRIAGVALCVMILGATAFAAEDRWYNFAEDQDLKYYLDQKSVVPRPGNIYLFWVKSVAKDKDFFKREYNVNNLSYLLTNFELDCSDATYRIRQIIMLDKNRRELNKSAPVGPETEFQPIPPESSIELAQGTVCGAGTQPPEEDEPEVEAPEARQPRAPRPSEEPSVSDEPPASEPDLSLQ